MSGDALASMLSAATMLVLVIAALVARRISARETVRNALAWLALFGVAIWLAAAWQAHRQRVDDAVDTTAPAINRSDLT